MFILAYYQHTCYLQIHLLYGPSYVFVHVNVTFIVCMCVYLVLGDQVVYIFFIYHVGMPRKKKFYRIKNRYKKKKEQPSSPDPPDYNSDSTTCISTPSTSTAFGETSLDDTTPKNPLDVLRSSVVLSESWSDHSPKNLENVLLCRISAH